MVTKSYTLSFLGDVMLGRLIDQMCETHVDCPEEARLVQPFKMRHPELRPYEPSVPWGNSLPLLKSSDLRLINLETAVTTHPTKWPAKVFNYRMHPQNLNILKAADINYTTLANNHTLDFSEQGLDETVESVTKAGFKYAGSAHSTIPEHRDQPAILPLDEYKIHVFAASDHPTDWAQVPQFNLIKYNVPDRLRLQRAIHGSGPAALKIFSVHWGPNYSWHPSQDIRDLAHFLIDECGIDIIHGHSSHHIQGIEIYKGKPIIYGCGDFVDDYAVTARYRNDLSAVWNVFVDVMNLEDVPEDVAEGLEEQFQRRLRPSRVEIHPSRIAHFQANLLDRKDPDHEWVVEKIRELSSDKLRTRIQDGLGDTGQIVISI